MTSKKSRIKLEQFSFVQHSPADEKAAIERFETTSRQAFTTLDIAKSLVEQAKPKARVKWNTLPKDLIIRVIECFSVRQAIQLRNVSKTQFVVPASRIPTFQRFTIGNYFGDITHLLSNTKAQETLRAYLRRVATLTISENNDTLTFIARLQFDRLTELYIGYVRTGDLTPLGNLTLLETLNLSGYQQGDLGPLSSLIRLRILLLDRYKTGSLDGLSTLIELEVLYLDSYKTGSLVPLSKLVKLKTLGLKSFTHGDLAPLASLVSVHDLELSSYRSGSLVPLSTLAELDVLDLRRYDDGSLEPLSKLGKLRELYLYSYEDGDLTPLSRLSKLKKLYLPKRIDHIAVMAMFEKALPDLKTYGLV